MPNPLTAYNPEWETFEGEDVEWSRGARHQVFGESAELELATELLGVVDEQELDRFIADLVRSIGRKFGAVIRSPLGQVLKGGIKTALPLAGGALGAAAGGPLGAQIGSGLASVAGRALGLELEGLSREDQELESAKRFVRFARETIANALAASPSDDPNVAVQAAMAAAARKSAPGLLRFARQPHGGRLRRRRGGAPPGIPMHFAEDSMHNIDRTQLESDPELEGYESSEFGWAGEAESVFSETEEMELASQLMEVSDEQELDLFLSDLIRKAGRALGNVIRSREGQAIGSILKGAVKQILPHAAGAASALIGGPLGAQIGSGLAALADNRGEMASESWDQEDWEYEGARQFVRFAADAVGNTMAAGSAADPMAAAQASVAQAAQMIAPGLLEAAAANEQEVWSQERYGSPGYGPPGYGHSGRWIRRGGTIVLFGV